LIRRWSATGHCCACSFPWRTIRPKLDRQGPDHGTQYRSEIFTQSEAQKRIAEAYVRQLEQAHVFGQKIETRIEPLPAFYAAEGYHQDYATLHPQSPYIATFDLPKVRNLERIYPDLFRRDPVLVASGH
jgi:peptide-methionine (S)-S-oxide reductase